MYTASDMIAREVKKAKEAGKKVVVSMSGVAASGGYYISLNADRIVAQPTTLTGTSLSLSLSLSHTHTKHTEHTQTILFLTRLICNEMRICYVYNDCELLVGSIGVLFGKFVLRQMWEKVGVSFDSVETTENSKFMSSLHRFSSQEKYVSFFLSSHFLILQMNRLRERERERTTHKQKTHKQYIVCVCMCGYVLLI
jgi:hypothetical protein